MSLTSLTFLCFSFIPLVAEFPSFLCLTQAHLFCSHCPLPDSCLVSHVKSTTTVPWLCCPQPLPFLICSVYAIIFVKCSLRCGHSSLYNTSVPLAGCSIKYQSCVPTSNDCCPFLVQILRFPFLQILGLLPLSEMAFSLPLLPV